MHTPPLSDDDKETVRDLLARIYLQIDWSKNKTKSAWDYWTSRIRGACTAPTLGEFTDRLCKLLKIRSLPPECLKMLDELRPLEAAVLDYLYRETVPAAVGSATHAKAIREARKALRKEQEES